MKFWIRINGVQEGPMEVEQMKQYNITPTTYVWCAGMKDWTYAKDVEVLEEVLLHCANESDTEQQTPQPTESDEPAAEPENIDEDDATEPKADDNDEANDEPKEDEPTADDADTKDDAPNAKTPQPIAPQQPVVQPATSQKSQDVPPCPPSNLVWAVIATVLCCQVTGIVAIVFAAQVSTKYNMGEYEKAQKYSDWAAWMVIASIVISILWSSLAFPIMMMGELMQMQ